MVSKQSRRLRLCEAWGNESHASLTVWLFLSRLSSKTLFSLLLCVIVLRASVTGWTPHFRRSKDSQLFAEFLLHTSTVLRPHEKFGVCYVILGDYILGVGAGNDKTSGLLSKSIFSFLFCICPVLALLVNCRTEHLHFYTYFSI